jgi:hypothetical protein
MRGAHSEPRPSEPRALASGQPQPLPNARGSDHAPRATLFCLLPLALLPASQPAPPQFEANTASGARLVGAVEALAPDWSVRLRARSKAALVKGADLVSLRRKGSPLPAFPASSQVVLANGDRVPLHARPELRLADERLHFRPRSPLGPAGLELKPPLQAVALVWLAPPPDAEVPALTLRRLLTGRRPHDLVLLRDGDEVRGALQALGPDGCRVLAGRRRVDLPLARVAVIALKSTGRKVDRPAGPHGHLVLTDGCRLALASAHVEGEREALAGKTLFGAAVEVPLARVAALDVRQGAAVYLSDLEPKEHAHQPYLSLSWPLVRDGAVDGGDLRLGGATYDKGLGMHSASRVTYALGGAYRRFEADVGLDERAGKRGRVRVEVLVDGKARDLGGRGELTAADGALRVRLDVHGAQTLTLVVHFGRFGDVQGRVNWCDARLIR